MNRLTRSLGKVPDGRVPRLALDRFHIRPHQQRILNPHVIFGHACRSEPLFKAPAHRTTIQGHDARQQDRVGAEWNDNMSHSLRPRNLI